jgi:hypothetical protein
MLQHYIAQREVQRKHTKDMNMRATTSFSSVIIYRLTLTALFKISFYTVT